MSPDSLSVNETAVAESYLRQETGVAETDALRQSLLDIFAGKTDVENIRVSGDLITYIRDVVLSSLAGIRRASAIGARSSMSPEEIAAATGLSKATVSRLITEHRNYS
jgi:hypothetical protein